MTISWLSIAGQALVILLTAVSSSLLTLWGQRYIANLQHEKMLERDRIQQQYVKEQERWKLLEPRMTALKDTAGRVLYLITGGGISGKSDEFGPLLRELDAMGGQFAEYPTVTRLLDSFEQAAGRILQLRGNPLIINADNKGLTQELRRYEQAYLPARYKALADAVNAILDNKRPEVPELPELPKGAISLDGWGGNGIPVK